MSTKTILIVDDDPLSISLISKVLMNRSTNGGFKILNANNGSQALEIAKTVVPNIIISDWEMPEMNGIDLIRLLKRDERTKEIPVVIASGFMISSNDMDMALAEGAVDYIRKPIDKVELVARIRSVLEMADYIKAIRVKNARILEQEKELLQKNIDQLEHDLEHKKRELASNISFLTQLEKEKENYLYSLEKLTPYLNSEGKNQLLGIRQQIKKNTNKTLLELEASFDEINHKFYEALSDLSSSITKNEKVLCAYMRMNLSPSEIATITQKTLNTINVSFSRIRVKLNMETNAALKKLLIDMKY